MRGKNNSPRKSSPQRFLFLKLPVPRYWTPDDSQVTYFWQEVVWICDVASVRLPRGQCYLILYINFFSFLKNEEKRGHPYAKIACFWLEVLLVLKSWSQLDPRAQLRLNSVFQFHKFNNLNSNRFHVHCEKPTDFAVVEKIVRVADGSYFNSGAANNAIRSLKNKAGA